MNNNYEKLQSLLQEKKVLEHQELDEVIKGELIVCEEKSLQCMHQIADVILSLEAEQEKFEKIAKLAKSKADKISKEIDRKKQVIKDAMQELGIKRASGGVVDYFICLNPPKLDVWDESKIPESYWVVKQTKEIDKMKLRQDLINGVEVTGASIIQGTRLAIK